MGRAKYQPDIGLYLGAWIDGDILVPEEVLPDQRICRNKRVFQQRLGKGCAFFSTYSGYGQPFPRYWVYDCLVKGASAVQINLETRTGTDVLDAVQDDSYLRRWAQDAADFECPIFLRFNAEMNCEWTPWHSNPPKYIEKFRLVHQVLSRIAPNVALVWSPGVWPISNLDQYFPGEAFVDWVGVSLYVTHHPNGDANQPIFSGSPCKALEPIYNRYATDFPLYLGEVGISHYCHVEGEITEWSQQMLHDMVLELQTRYPRVHAWNWFSYQHIRKLSDQSYPYIPIGGKIKDTSILSNSAFELSYQECIGLDYFLSKISD